MNELSGYRLSRIENALTNKRTPGAVLDMYLARVADKAPEQAAALADVRALECDSCDYRKRCAYRDSPARLPEGVEGGLGCCLRFYRERLGGNGFFLPNGEPLKLDEEAVEALKEALEE